MLKMARASLRRDDMAIDLVSSHTVDVMARFRRGGRFRQSPARRDPAPGLLEGLPIVVVEDDPASARLMRLVLATEGAQVDVAQDAASAHELLARTGARAVIVDLLLPGINGLLFVRQLKSDPDRRHIVAVAVSAMNGEETARLALSAGCARYLRKPIDVTTFAALVRQCLDEAQ
jgi:CheY-like chemotaxis protein